MSDLQEESDSEMIEASKPILRRTPWKQITIGVGVTVLGGIAWVGLTILAGTPVLERTVEANESKVNGIEETLNETVVPSLKSIQTKTESISKDVDEIKDDLDRVEQRQFEGVQ